MKLPLSILSKLELRKQNNALRTLPVSASSIDFSSNDYLGFAKLDTIYEGAHQLLVNLNLKQNGATGSRLISGNHPLYQQTEAYIAHFHQAEAALLFNSGYDANVGFFSSVPQRQDVILFDELCHASIRDGIQLATAKSFKFVHNDWEELERKIQKCTAPNTTIYVVIESVYSMDGDSPNLEELAALCEKYSCYLVVDEAHALGVFGDEASHSAEGLIQAYQLQDKIFARIMTFGKGLGCHGAAILGSEDLKHYLVNFARSFIYTTGLPPHAVATILTAYQQLETNSKAISTLKENIVHFNQEKNVLGLKPMFVYSKSAIHCAIISGNENVKNIASQLQEKGFEVKAILSPTVPAGQERLRFCLHSYNTQEEISTVLQELSNLIFNS